MKNKHVMLSCITGKGQTYIVVQGYRQTATITLNNDDGKKNDDCAPVVDDLFSFIGSSVQQNDI